MRAHLYPIAAPLAAVALAACAAQPAPAPAVVAADSGSIFAGSEPAAGSTVTGPLYRLVLRFDPPARLDEVLVDGPSGTMPMMVSAAGDQPQYVIPLSGLATGAYRVNWRATAAGAEQRGSFAFTVK